MADILVGRGVRRRAPTIFDLIQGPATAAQSALGAMGSAAKGAAQATVGLPGDVESLVRMITGGEQTLPTTEQVGQFVNQYIRAPYPQYEKLGEFTGLPTAGALTRPVTQLTNEATDALVRAITGNPQATAQRVIQETSMPFMQAVAPKSIHDEYYNLTAKANELYSKLRSGGMDKDVLDEYKAVRARRDELQTQVFPEPLAEPTPTGLLNQSYQGQHTAPMKDSGAPLWKLEDVYPEDFYSSLGARYYGDGAEPARDARLVSLIQSFRNHPDRPVTIYRAIPKDIDAKINVGDWVTLDRQYAKEHGQSALNNNYKIVRKTVKARDLFTNGDSIYEFGYDPQPFIPKRKKPE